MRENAADIAVQASEGLPGGPQHCKALRRGNQNGAGQASARGWTSRRRVARWRQGERVGGVAVFAGFQRLIRNVVAGGLEQEDRCALCSRVEVVVRNRERAERHHATYLALMQVIAGSSQKGKTVRWPKFLCSTTLSRRLSTSQVISHFLSLGCRRRLFSFLISAKWIGKRPE